MGMLRLVAGDARIEPDGGTSDIVFGYFMMFLKLLSL
jgi:hypothetical protein